MLRTMFRAVALLAAAGILAGASSSSSAPPRREDVEQIMGLRSEGDMVRGQMDTVGFVVTKEQAEDVVSSARRLEADSLSQEPENLIAAVCPHDDHLYAARVYVHATEHVSAPRVILFGVFHKARLWGLHDRLVFDRFEAWHGPWGPVPVDNLRSELIAGLEDGDIVVDNTMHCREHSLEAIVPFLQARNPGVRIVPILVPYMDWDRIEILSERLSIALAGALKRHGWVLGRDVAIVVSTDAVHYGDDFEHTPFGTDAPGYEKAVEREHGLARDFLEGPLQSARLHGLFDRLVDSGNVEHYLIPWCGRFSVPFGLEVVRRTAAAMGMPVPRGTLLRYGTSLSEGELPVRPTTRSQGLGYTAPSSLHHWVGYAAIGYVVPGEQGGTSAAR